MEDRRITATLTRYMEPDKYKDVIMRGAADEWLSKAKGTPMLYAHDHSKILGIWERAWLDGDDVKAEGEIHKGTYGDEAMRHVDTGILKGVSIGFRSKDFDWSGSGLVFNKIEIYEASIVLFPAHPAASIDERQAAKSEAMARAAKRQDPSGKLHERRLRELRKLTADIGKPRGS